MTPWLHELDLAVPSLAVVPRLRFLVIRHARGFSDFAQAVELENVAWQISMGKLKLYMTFVQLMMTLRVAQPSEFEKLCKPSDSTQDRLSEINMQRNQLLAKIHALKFTCPEVPETAESYRACPKCRGTDLQAIEKQTRSADEGGTVFYTCNNVKCGFTFR